MKHTLIPVLAILLLAAMGRGQSQTNQAMLRLEKLEDSVKGDTNYLIIGTSTPPVAVSGDITMPDIVNGDYTSSLTLTDEGIRKLAASGEICKALGRHFWRPGRPGEGEGSSYGGWYADYHPGTTYRTCAVCGKPESKTEGEWK